MDADKVDRWMVDAFVSAHETAPEEIVLDLDATDDPIHGAQHAIVSFAQAEVCLNAGLHVLPKLKTHRLPISTTANPGWVTPLMPDRHRTAQEIKPCRPKHLDF